MSRIIDYKQLLVKYMKLVYEETGSTYTAHMEMYPDTISFSEEEKDELDRISVKEV